MKLKKALLGGLEFWLVLSLLLSSCKTLETEYTVPAQIKKLEVQGNEINIYTNRPVEAGAYISPSPPRLILTIENADLVKGITTSGEATGGFIKSWEAKVKEYEKSIGEETKIIYNVVLSADLTKNVTYQLTNTDFGCKLVLEEIKMAEKQYAPAMAEIPRELYPTAQKIIIGPTGKGTTPVSTEEEKTARAMLKEILPEPAKVEKLPPVKVITDLSYRTIDKIFEVVITGNGEFRDFKTSTQAKLPIIYIDIFGVQSQLKSNQFPVNVGMVREIRVGKYQDKIRVSIELKGEIKDARIVNVADKLIVQIVY